MKPLTTRFSSLLALTGGLLLLSPATQAATLYWDVDGSTAGFSTVVGAWDGTNSFWNTDATGGAGGSLTAVTTSADDLIISQATTNTGSITVTGTLSASSISFAANVGPTATITGGTSITIGGIGTYSGIRQLSTGANTISTALILNSAISNFNFSNSSTGLLTIGAVTGAATTGTQTITVGSSSSGGITLNGIIGNGAGGGTVSLNVNNTSTGVTNLTAANTYSGATTVTAGTLSLTGVSGYKTTALSVASGATLGITMTGNATSLGANTSGTWTTFNSVNAAITGAGVVVLNGTNFIAAGGSAGTMTTNLSAGAVLDVQSGSWAWGYARASAATNLGSLNVDSGAEYRNSDTAFQFDALTGAGTVANAYSGTVTLTLGVNNTTNNATYGVAGNSATFSGVIKGPDTYIGVTTGTLNLVKAGAGTQILSGINTYTGTTTINSGTLAVSGGTAIANTGAVVLANTAGATFQLNSSETIGNLSGGGTTGGNVNLQNNTLTLGDAGSQTFAGIISGTNGSLTKQGAGALTLSAVPTYTGATTISAGTLTLGSGITTGSSVLATSGITLSQGATLLFNASANGAQSVTVPITLSGGAGTASIKIGSNDKRMTLSGGVIGQAGVAQTLAITTGAVAAGSGDRNTLTFTGAIANGGSGGTLGVNIDFAGASGVGQNAFVNLQGSNTFTGNLNITNTKGINGGSTYAGAWVTIGGERYGVTPTGTTNSFGQTTGNGFLGAAGDYSGGISISNGTGLTTLSFLSTADQILRGVITGTGALRQDGVGTLTLTGTNNYTGTTTVTSGKMLLSSTGSLAAGSAVTVSGGALGGTGTVNGTVTVSSTGGVNLGDGVVGNLTLGSTLAITGAAGANNLSFDLGNTTNTTDKLIVGGATTVTNAGAAVINLNQLGGTAGRNTAGTYTLIQGTTSMAALGQFALATDKAFGQTFTLGVVGNDLQVTTAQVTSVTPAAFWAGSSSINWSDAANWRSTVAGNGAVAGAPDYQTNVTFATTTPGPLLLTTNVLDVDFDINSLNFNVAAGGVTIGGTKMLTIEGVTGVNGNAANNGINSANTSGTNTISAKVGLASSQTWTVASGGTLAVSGVISDFGGGYALTKAGAGTLTLSGTNTYSGGTILAGGILSISANSNLGAATSGITLTANSQITNTGASVNYTRAIGLDNFTLTLRNGAAVTSTFSGAITGTGGITMAAGSSGTINLSSTGNTFTGNVTLPTGTGSNEYLTFASIGDGGSIIFGRASWLANAQYTGSTNLNWNTRSISLATTFGGTTGLDGGGSPISMFANNGTGTVTINPAMGVTTTASSGFFFLGGTNTGDNTFAGAIADPTGANTLGIGKWDAGKWILSNATNSYQGTTWITNGTLSVNAIDVAGNAQPLGTGSSIIMGHFANTGTLEYTGSTNATTNKQVQIGTTADANGARTGGATILNNGTGSLTFSNAAFNSATTLVTAARTLTLGGTYTGGINEIQGVIQNNLATGVVSLTKSGSGTWTLSGLNTYTGATNVSAGTLTLSGGNSAATNGSMTVGSTGNNAILNISAGTYTYNTKIGVEKLINF